MISYIKTGINGFNLIFRLTQQLIYNRWLLLLLLAIEQQQKIFLEIKKKKKKSYLLRPDKCSTWMNKKPECSEEALELESNGRVLNQIWNKRKKSKKKIRLKKRVQALHVPRRADWTARRWNPVCLLAMNGKVRRLLFC